MYKHTDVHTFILIQSVNSFNVYLLRTDLTRIYKDLLFFSTAGWTQWSWSSRDLLSSYD